MTVLFINLVSQCQSTGNVTKRQKPPGDRYFFPFPIQLWHGGCSTAASTQLNSSQEFPTVAIKVNLHNNGNELRGQTRNYSGLPALHAAWISWDGNWTASAKLNSLFYLGLKQELLIFQCSGFQRPIQLSSGFRCF